MTKMNNKAMEEEIKKLQKHMGGLVRTIVDLKSKVDALETKNENNELQNIIEKQAIIDEAIAANSTAINRIDQEILSYSKIKKKETLDEKNVDETERKDNMAEEFGENNRSVG